MQLNAIAQILSGYHFRGAVRDYPRGPVPVLQVGDFDESLRFDPATVQRIEPDFDPEPQRVHDSDVLFLARGRRHWATPADGAAGMVVPGYFFVIRPDRSQVLPEYLAWWLNHPRTRAHLDLMQRGSNIPFIRMTDFRDLEIPLPQLETQRRLVAVSELSARERQLSERLHDLQDHLLLAVAERHPAPRRANRSR